MKRRKLCKKHLLALMLSAAMIFTSADISVLASENGNVTNTVNDGGTEDGTDAGASTESGAGSDEAKDNPGGA